MYRIKREIDRDRNREIETERQRETETQRMKSYIIKKKNQINFLMTSNTNNRFTCFTVQLVKSCGTVASNSAGEQRIIMLTSFWCVVLTNAVM